MEYTQNHENQLNAGYDKLCRDDLPESVSHESVLEATACGQFLKSMGEPEHVLCVDKLFDHWDEDNACFAAGTMWFGEYEIKYIGCTWMFENLYQNIQPCMYPSLIEGLKTTEKLVSQGVG